MPDGAAFTSGVLWTFKNALQLGMAQTGFAAGLSMPAAGGTQRHVPVIANRVSVCRRYPGCLSESESDS